MEVNYSKKCDLPGFSSHQYMVTLRTELTDLARIATKTPALPSTIVLLACQRNA